ncbi:MAG TPA: sigma-70 family RNA polymerase sigma factor [Acidisphaera sp.]|nr:sigma-70 family RNA polymerase sigma factor [Acidisphaera sp.]
MRQDAALVDAGEDAAGLLRAVAGGDRRALRRLYEIEAGRLHAVALRIVRDASLAADVLHDAFLSVWRNAAQFDPARGAASAWLTGIVRNRALDIARRASREVTGTELPETVDETPDALSDAVRTQEEAALHRCLGTLEEDRRGLIVMAFVGGLTHAEVAQRSGIPLGTVKSHIRRGLLALRSCLEALERGA